MELAGSIASEITKDLLSTTKRQARYFFCFNNIVENFGNEKEKLILTQQSMLKHVEVATNNTEKIGNDVKKWLEDAESLREETEKLETETQRKRKCFLGWCPNFIWQYRLGRKVVKKTQKVTELNANSQFKNFSRLATLPGIEYHGSEDFVYFESRKLAYDKLLEALTDEESFRVGLYGMGGSGKSNLVTEVGKQLEKSKLFDKVIFVVSNPPDIRRIQGNIASSLGLKFEEEQEFDRAKRLWLRLTNGGKILIILDDVWEKLDFKSIGIPLDNNHKGCRVLITSRSLELCKSMVCQETIELSLLTDDEAWSLFQEHAGITGDSSKTLKGLAQEITNECRGLPIAIAAVASTLKNKPLEDWEAALETLREHESMDDVDENLKKVYACLALCYDNLKNAKAKSLFLLCSIFPKDYEIPVEDLTRFGIGLGLFGEANSYKRARSQVAATKNKLIDSCLLLKAKEGQCVKMHDLVRDVALWIVRKEIQVIMGTKRDPNAMAENVILEDNVVRYLGCHVMSEFPDQLDCPKLEILLVNTVGGYHTQVPDEFFGGMKELRVLVLMNRDLFVYDVTPFLPQSVQLLTNLRTLRLSAWTLGDMSALINLQRLETLELYHCEIRELPNEMIQLKNLRLLYLSECKLEKNPYEVIGRCSQLEELAALDIKRDTFEWWNEGDIATKFFKQDGCFPRLQRYGIEIGGSFGLNKSMDNMISRGLSIEYFEAGTSNEIIKDLVRRAEILHLQRIRGGYRTFSPDIVQAIGGMSELFQLRLDFCSEIESLIDTTNPLSSASVIFSKLVKLVLKDMDHLEELCHGPPPCDFFQNLEGLYIYRCSQLNSIFVEKLNLCRLKAMLVKDCPTLTFLFTPSIAQSLELLETLEIDNCKELKYIITDQMEEKRGDEIIEDHDHNHDQKSYVSTFPKLKSLRLTRCYQMEFIFPFPCAAGGLAQLEAIRVDKAAGLKYIFGKYQREGEGQPLHLNQQEIILPSLKSISFVDMPNFINICEDGSRLRTTCTDTLIRHSDPMASTELLASQRNNSNGPLIPLRTAHSLSKQSLDLCNIIYMRLEGCPNLTSLFTLSTAQLMLLKSLYITECQRLEFIITDEEDDHDRKNYDSIFPRLELLEVSNCCQLKSVFGQYLHRDHLSYQHQNQIHIDLPALDKLELYRLPNIISICPKNFYLTWPSLERFIVDECPQLTITCISDFMVHSDVTQVDQTAPKESRAIATGRTTPSNRVEDQTLQDMQTMRGIEVNKCKIEGIFHLQGLPINGQLVNTRLEHVRLCNLPELMYICKGPAQFLSLKNLASLYVIGCSKLKAIFSVSILRSLPLLITLIIRDCEQLEQITEDDEDQVLLNHSSQQMYFPKLIGLKVQRCNNLRRLFCFPTTHELRKLNLTVEEASNVERFFRLKGDFQTDTEPEAGKAIFQLQEKLPSFTKSCQGFDFKKQDKNACLLYVCACPKLNLTTTATAASSSDIKIEENPLELGSFQMVPPNIDCIVREINNENPTREIIPHLETASEDPNSEVEATSKIEVTKLPSQSNPTQSMPINFGQLVHEYNQNDSSFKSYEFLVMDTETKGRQELQTEVSIHPMDPQETCEEEKSSPAASSKLKEELFEKGSSALTDEQEAHEDNKAATETPKGAATQLDHVPNAMESTSNTEVHSPLNFSLSATSQSLSSIAHSPGNFDLPTPAVEQSKKELIRFAKMASEGLMLPGMKWSPSILPMEVEDASNNFLISVAESCGTSGSPHPSQTLFLPPEAMLPPAKTILPKEGATPSCGKVVAKNTAIEARAPPPLPLPSGEGSAPSLPSPQSQVQKLLEIFSPELLGELEKIEVEKGEAQAVSNLWQIAGFMFSSMSRVKNAAEVKNAAIVEIAELKERIEELETQVAILKSEAEDYPALKRQYSDLQAKYNALKDLS